MKRCKSLPVTHLMAALSVALNRSSDESANIRWTPLSNSLCSSSWPTFQYSQEVLKNHDIRISMDGKARAMGNIMVERLWRIKYEDIYTKDYETVEQLIKGIRSYFWFYNNERPIKAWGTRPPLRCISSTRI